MFSKSIDNIINEKSNETYAFLRLLRKELPDLIPSNLPLISISTPSEGSIRVYKNIQFDVTKVKRKIWLDNDTFKPTIKGLEGKLQYTTENGHLGVSFSLKLTSFLSRYLNKNSLKDHQIRDISNSIMHSLHTNLLSVVQCNSSEDHVALYEVHALSCMSPKQHEYSEYNTTLKTFLYNKHGIWPSMWYHYNPHTKGVFLRVGKRGVARAILLRKDVNKEFKNYYPTIYAESGFYDRKFQTILQQEIGLKPEYDNVSIQNRFKVPAILLFSIPICPLPFHDCITGCYSCYYNKNEKVFYFGPKNSLPSTANTIRDPYNYCGYIDANMNIAHLSIPRSELK